MFCFCAPKPEGSSHWGGEQRDRDDQDSDLEQNRRRMQELRQLQFVEQQRIRPLGAGIALADSDLLERNRRLMQRLRFARHVCAARRYDRDDR
jgi:hypothetical protein